MGDIGYKGRKVAHLHARVHDKLAAEPHGGDYGGIHTKAHDRLKEYHDLHGAHTGLFKVAVGLCKFLFLMILAHKGLDYADICDVFLNGGVEPVDFGLHSGETGESHFGYDKYCDKQHRYAHKEYHGQSRLERNGHHKRADHHAGSAQRHSQHHVDKVLKLGHVVGETGDKRAGGKSVDVGKGKGLNLFIDVVSYVGRKVDRGLGSEIGAAHAAEHHT